MEAGGPWDWGGGSGSRGGGLSKILVGHIGSVRLFFSS